MPDRGHESQLPAPSSPSDDRPLPGPPARELERAQRWLARELERAGGIVPSAELERAAARAAIAPRTLKRARRALGTLSQRNGGRWYVIEPATPDTEALHR